MQNVCSILIMCLLISEQMYGQIQSNNSGNWSNPSTWVGGVVPNSSTADVEIISSHTITVDSDITIRNINMIDGAINLGPHEITIYGTITGNDRNNVNSNVNTELVIVGNTANSFEFPSSIFNLKKLTINRLNGARSNSDIDLDDAVPGDGIVLVLNLGVLYMNNGSILYLNSKQIQLDIPCSDLSYVDGPIQRNVAKNAGMYIFPVGSGGFCRPFGVATQNGNSNNINQVQLVKEDPNNINSVDYSKLPGGIIDAFYWKHDVISGANPQRRLYYDQDDDFPGVSSEDLTNSMTLANTNGSGKWNKATTNWSVYDEFDYIEFDNANASNSTYWTLGSIDGAVSYENITLPISLLDFYAEEQNGDIYLYWSTENEQNNNGFVIERSYYGSFFNEIGFIKGKGTTTKLSKYTYIDADYSHEKVYYRLKQIDNDGTITYTGVISYTVPSQQNKADITQTSSLKNQINIKFDYSEQLESTIYIYNSFGNKIYELKVFPEINKTISIPISNTGIYFVNFQNSSSNFSRSMFVP